MTPTTQQRHATVLVAVRPMLLADVLRKALGDAGAIQVVVAHDVRELPWQQPWDVAVLSTDVLAITEVTGDAYLVCVPGDVPARVTSAEVDDLVTIVRTLALGGAEPASA